MTEQLVFDPDDESARWRVSTMRQQPIILHGDPRKHNGGMIIASFYGSHKPYVNANIAASAPLGCALAWHIMQAEPDVYDNQLRVLAMRILLTANGFSLDGSESEFTLSEIWRGFTT